jgi:hypothetical protein
MEVSSISCVHHLIGLSRMVYPKIMALHSCSISLILKWLSHRLVRETGMKERPEERAVWIGSTDVGARDTSDGHVSYPTGGIRGKLVSA